MENNILSFDLNNFENDGYLETIFKDQLINFIKNDRVSCFIYISLNDYEFFLDILPNSFKVFDYLNDCIIYLSNNIKNILKHSLPSSKIIFNVKDSLFTVQELEGYNAYIFRVQNDKLTIERKLIKKGLSIQSIYDMYFDGNGKSFSSNTEAKLNKFYTLLAKVKKPNCPEEVLKSFTKIKNELLDYSEEIKVIISREITQLERIKANE